MDPGAARAPARHAGLSPGPTLPEPRCRPSLSPGAHGAWRLRPFTSSAPSRVLAKTKSVSLVRTLPRHVNQGAAPRGALTPGGQGGADWPGGGPQASQGSWQTECWPSVRPWDVREAGSFPTSAARSYLWLGAAAAWLPHSRRTWAWGRAFPRTPRPCGVCASSRLCPHARRGAAGKLAFRQPTQRGRAWACPGFACRLDPAWPRPSLLVRGGGRASPPSVPVPASGGPWKALLEKPTAKQTACGDEASGPKRAGPRGGAGRGGKKLRFLGGSCGHARPCGASPVGGGEAAFTSGGSREGRGTPSAPADGSFRSEGRPDVVLSQQRTSSAACAGETALWSPRPSPGLEPSRQLAVGSRPQPCPSARAGLCAGSVKGRGDLLVSLLPSPTPGGRQGGRGPRLRPSWPPLRPSSCRPLPAALGTRGAGRGGWPRCPADRGPREPAQAGGRRREGAAQRSAAARPAPTPPPGGRAMRSVCASTKLVNEICMLKLMV